MHTADVIRLLFKIGGWFSILSAAICVAIAIFTYLHARDFVATASRARGAIVRMLEGKSDSDTIYYPVFSFTDDRGVGREINSSIGSFPPAYNIGDSVTVLYPANQPQKAELDRFFDIWGWPAITGRIAAIDLLLGAALLIIPPIIIKKLGKDPTTENKGTFSSAP